MPPPSDRPGGLLAPQFVGNDVPSPANELGVQSRVIREIIEIELVPKTHQYPWSGRRSHQKIKLEEEERERSFEMGISRYMCMCCVCVFGAHLFASRPLLPSQT